jgi:hypothetical protein
MLNVVQHKWRIVFLTPQALNKDLWFYKKSFKLKLINPLLT